MIRRHALTIGGLMWVTVIIALDLAALRNASETWARIMFPVTCGILASAAVAAVFRPATERPLWLGFVVFGAGYLLLARRDPWRPGLPALPTSWALYVLAPWFGQQLPWWPSFIEFGVPIESDNAESFAQIGRYVWSLVVATVGGLLMLTLYGPLRRRTAAAVTTQESREETQSKWWRRPAAIALSAAGLCLALSLAAFPREPELLAGLVYLTTAAVVGTSFVGAFLTRGRCRAAWLGAALFSGGYFTLYPDPAPEAWPRCRAVDDVVSAVRSGLVSGVEVLHGPSFVKNNRDNLRVRQKLEQRVAIPFPDETEFELVLRHIKKSTQGPNDSGIPFYIDPIGLQAVERTMMWPVQLDFEGLPVRVSLPLILKQLGLTYYVRGGMVFLTSNRPEDVPPPIVEEPYFLVSHGIITCLAAAFGSVLAQWLAVTIFHQRQRWGSG